MFKLEAEKNRLTVTEKELLTSGSAGVSFLEIAFSEDWAGLEKIAVFRAGAWSESVPLEGDGPWAIPWEILARAGKVLYAGVFGVREEVVVLPTVWAQLGYIQPGVRPGREDRPGTDEGLLEELREELERLKEKLEQLQPGGSGAFAFEVNEAGHLVLHYAGEEAPAFRLDRENGHLYLDIM